MADTAEFQIETKPHQGTDAEGFPTEEVKVIGRVIFQGGSLYESEVIASDDVETVCHVKEDMALRLRDWVLEHSDLNLPAERVA